MNLLHDSVQPLAERLGWAVLHSLWQGAALSLLLLLVLRWLRRHSAAARYAACLLALVALLGMAVVTAWRVEISATSVASSVRAATPPPVPPSEKSMAFVPAPSHEPAEPLATPSPSNDTPTAPAAIPATISPRHWAERLQPWVPWIAALWFAGVVLLSLRHICGWWRIRRWRAAGEAPGSEMESLFARLAERFQLRGKVWLRQSAEAFAPMLTGVLRPIVLFPARLATGLTEREVEAILAHELAHLARRDTWSNLAHVLVEIVLFYHPAVWWMSRRARLEREHAADDLALRYCEDRRQYAGALARLAEMQCAPSFTLAATGGNLLTRIRRIVLPPPREPATGAWTLPALTVALALAGIFLFRTHAEEPKIISVKAGESLQAAIDAAPAGAVIKVGEGEWKERIVISKPLTLEGAGWEKTLLFPDQHDPRATQQRKELEERAKAVLDPAESARIWKDEDATYEPTITVRDTDKVIVRGIKIRGLLFEGRNVARSLYSDPLVTFLKAKGTLAECAVTGYYDGVKVSDGSDVQIRGCLIAAMWSDGVHVYSGGRVELMESEVRNCCYANVVVGRRAKDSHIEKCRFSGTAWHGIRYDDASPTITGCRFFNIARCGIYASGKTNAVVKDNLFQGVGIWCLLGSDDTIEGNTFVDVADGALGVSGGAKTRVIRNVFANSGAAITCTKVNGTDPQAQIVGDPKLEANVFWSNKVNFKAGDETKPVPAGNLEADPKFVAAAQRDYTLATDSPARAAKAGAATPLGLASPWPLLAEEKAIIPDEDTRDVQYWKTSAGSAPSKRAEDLAKKAQTDAKSWVDDAFQLEDKAKREAAIERVRQAMLSKDADEARAGAVAFGRLGPIEFDKPSFRPAIRTLLSSADVTTRVAAARGFPMTGVDPEDMSRIYALADDPSPEMRSALTVIIVWLTKYDLTGKEATTAILKLMDKMPKDPRDIAHALWGSKFSPEIEARVLEYCRNVDTEMGYSFFYGSLSTQANKSEASCKRLIEILAHQDTTNKAGRAAWGLQQGVAKEQYNLVADAMLRVIEARSDSYLRKNALSCLSRYGGAAQVEGVKALLAKPGMTGDFRKQLEEILPGMEAQR
jgi:beta-lactamase regulating signal transducer with metallopeptidase domain/nitrous oxidase accessory protein NosD